tara:strand:- start:218 stop:460 length:243 start_codon:yes stop_codon:yes gene_type:complete
MEEQYTKDFLVADFTNQIQVTEENIVKLREEIARQTQQLVRLNGAVEALNMVKDAPSATEEEAEETLDEILEETEVEDAE